jgi:hypothetical protein
MDFGLFGCNQAATLRRACEQADGHALGSRYHSTGSANLHLAPDRSGRAVWLTPNVVNARNQVVSTINESLSHYRAVLAADTRIAAQSWRHRHIAGDPDPIISPRNIIIGTSVNVFDHGGPALVSRSQRCEPHRLTPKGGRGDRRH